MPKEITEQASDRVVKVEEFLDKPPILSKNPLSSYQVMSNKANKKKHNFNPNGTKKGKDTSKHSITKSFVEDCSEDFSNIEEHLSSLNMNNFNLKAKLSQHE